MGGFHTSKIAISLCLAAAPAVALAQSDFCTGFPSNKIPGGPCTAAAPGVCSCLKQVAEECLPTDLILTTFVRRGGCETFGWPHDRVRPRLSAAGRFQTFQWGEIATQDVWQFTGNPSPDFVLSAIHTKQDISVRWDWLGPSKYDSVLVSWFKEDHSEAVAKQSEDKPQRTRVDVPSGGEVSIPFNGLGIYTISIEGACSPFSNTLFGACKSDGPSQSVQIDQLPVLPPPVPRNPQPPLIYDGFPVDVPDTVTLTPTQSESVLSRLCEDGLLEADAKGGHLGELKSLSALAKLGLAKVAKPCMSVSPPELNAAVNDAIRKATVISIPGTDVRDARGWLAGLGVFALVTLVGAAVMTFFSAFPGVATALALIPGLVAGLVAGFLVEHTAGDYDMRLVGFVQMAYRFSSHLDPDARSRLIHELLTEKGGEEQRKEHVYIFGLPTPIPETENHIWMTESSRYLTNQLRAQELQKQSLPVPKEYDNRENGMNLWMLRGLQRFLKEDFYEVNARPYSHHVIQAIQNLAEFAAFGLQCRLTVPPPPAQDPACDVRRAARNVLDFHAAKFALSSNQLRRAAPFRRQPPFRTYTKLWTNGSDDMTWRYLTHVAGSNVFRQERASRLAEYAPEEMMLAMQSTYRPPTLLTSLIRSPSSAPGDPVQRFRSTARGGDVVELYVHHPAFSISAGGRHDNGTGLSFLSDGEDAWALPTTLMPRSAGGDYRDFVRIEGASDDKVRVNTCVAPGFACGTNPALPSGLPNACKQTEGDWTFVNFDANTAECPFDYGFYVAMYTSPCKGGQCAGYLPGPREFMATHWGFFDVGSARTFESYKAEVLALNASKSFSFDARNVFTSPQRGDITFEPASSNDTWPIVSYQVGTTVFTPNRAIRDWPVAAGGNMSSPQLACILVDNLNLKQRLILDHTNLGQPRRSVVPLPSPECGCPLRSSCIGLRAE